MSSNANVDRYLREWMEDGPSELPDRVLDQLALQLDATAQRRRRQFPWISPGDERMKRLFLSIAATAVLLVAAVGVYATVDSIPGVGGAPDTEPNRFVSERHGYTLELPGESWRVIQFPGTWALGTAFSDGDSGVDRAIDTDAPSGPFVLVNSQAVPQGMTFDEWLDDHREAHARAFPTCILANSEPAEMDGVDAVYDLIACSSDLSVEVSAMRGGRAYVLRVFGPSPPWDPHPVMEEWLGRFSFANGQTGDR